MAWSMKIGKNWKQKHALWFYFDTLTLHLREKMRIFFKLRENRALRLL